MGGSFVSRVKREDASFVCCWCIGYVVKQCNLHEDSVSLPNQVSYPLPRCHALYFDTSHTFLHYSLGSA